MHFKSCRNSTLQDYIHIVEIKRRKVWMVFLNFCGLYPHSGNKTSFIAISFINHVGGLYPQNKITKLTKFIYNRPILIRLYSYSLFYFQSHPTIGNVFHPSPRGGWESFVQGRCCPWPGPLPTSTTYFFRIFEEGKPLAKREQNEGNVVDYPQERFPQKREYLRGGCRKGGLGGIEWRG